MKIAEIRIKATKDLTADVTKIRQDIAEATRRRHLGEVQNVRTVRKMRKDLARMLTVLGEHLREEAK